MATPYAVDLLDVSDFSYMKRLLAVSLQGLVNRSAPRLFLDYGIYDDPKARETNEVFLSDDIWHQKYRDTIGNQDQMNLAYYQRIYQLEIRRTDDLVGILRKYRDAWTGMVVWDPLMPDTVNVALMLGALENHLVVHPDLLDEMIAALDTGIAEDLRGKWKDRVPLYTWARKHLFHRCTPGQIASIEPGWERPEFLDYIVQNRIFVYSLSTLARNSTFSIGQKLLLLLVAGPFFLRNVLYNLRLDGLIRRIGLLLMGWSSPETRLASHIQRSVKAQPFPAIFGWHTRRDDEFSFMLHLSANGLRLVPSHLASNFSFHSRLPAKVTFKQNHVSSVQLEDKIYLTFTLSDGDQLVLMSTAELGNWRRAERGAVPFNWEVQPLLVDIAPALLGQFYDSLTPQDYLIAGPSGAGYIVPPLMPRLRHYLEESAVICRRADIRVISSYIGDPAERVVRLHCTAPGDFIGFLAGYVHFGRTPASVYRGRPFVSSRVPHLDHVADSSEDTLAAVRRLIDEPGPLPRFIGVHLFAYRTTITDVYHFVQTLGPEVKVVRADEFLLAAMKHLSRESS